MQKFVKEQPKEGKSIDVKDIWQAFIGLLLILIVIAIVLGILRLCIGGLFALCKIIYLVLFTL